MAINWPTIAQGTGTGTTYTPPAPGNNTWTWSGYAWGSTGTTTDGGFNSPWVIFNQYGKARAFSTLKSAMSIAVDGDTIHLFKNITELINSMDYIVFKNVNINLNGFTYTLNADGNNSSYNRAFTNNGLDVNVKISNGNILCTNASPTAPFVVFEETSSVNTIYGCDWRFESVTITKDSGISPVCLFSSSVAGGIFKDTSTVEGNSALYIYALRAPFNYRVIIRDCIGISSKGIGIKLRGGASELLTTVINCKGYSSFSGSIDIYSGIDVNSPSALTDTNRFRLINCLGVNNFDAERSALPSVGSFGISTSEEVTLINCDGKSASGGGIKTDGSTLIRCFGDSRISQSSTLSNSFYSLGSSVLKRCSSVGDGTYGNNTVFRTEGAIRYGSTGEYIDGCNFESPDVTSISLDTSGIRLVSGPTTNTINISNSTISGISFGILMDFGSSIKLNVSNSKISHTDSSSFSTHWPILLYGESTPSGSIFANNIFQSKGYSDAISRDRESPHISAYMSNNTCINVDQLYTSIVGTIVQGMTSVIDSKMNIQQNI